MTKNPLLAERASDLVGMANALRPGETLTVQRKDLPPITILRTNRSYVEDLRDAYNAALRRSDIEWFVTPTGELKLRDVPEWSAKRTKQIELKREAERQAWLRTHRQAQYSDPRADRNSGDQGWA